MTFQIFQKLGWCTGVKGTRTNVDKMCIEYDESIKSWKKFIQVIYFFQQMVKSNFSMNQYKPNLNSLVIQQFHEHTLIHATCNNSNEQDKLRGPQPAEDEALPPLDTCASSNFLKSDLYLRYRITANHAAAISHKH